MKKILLTFALLLSAITFSTPAKALMIDPFFSYEFGEGSAEKFSGPQFGARLAWDMLGFWAGAEYATGSLKGADSDTTSTVTDLGLSVGYKFPILVRAYGTYILNAKSETSGAELTGTGTKIGFGYTGLPFISLNYEIISRSYSKLNGNDLTSNVNMNSNAISVSYTLSF